MTSLLYVAPHSGLTPAEGFALKSAQMDTHAAIMGIVDEVRELLPEGLQDRAHSIVITGLVTALGRLFAEAPDQAEAYRLISSLSLTVFMEQASWREREALH